MTMEKLSDALGGGVKDRSPGAIYRRAAERIDSVDFAIDAEERRLRKEVFEAKAAWKCEEMTYEQAWLIEAENLSTVLLRRKPIETRMPSTPAFADYVRVQAMIRSHHRNASPPPTERDIKAAFAHAGAFYGWYRPIEDHQRDCERLFFMLYRFGDHTHRVVQDALASRGDEVDTQLCRAINKGVLPWLPVRIVKAFGFDHDWDAELFGSARAYGSEDITRAWSLFSVARPRFQHPAPAEQELF